MKLWLLKPIENETGKKWYNKRDANTGFVIRAETEHEARILANETILFNYNHDDEWLNVLKTTCKELLPDGEKGLVLSGADIDY